MSDILVLYKSKYGATKKYTELMKAKLNSDVFDADDFKKAEIEKYRTVIFAGAIYANGISGLNVLRKNYDVFNGKKIIIFCVGASPFEEKAFNEIRNHNLKDDLKDIPIFYGRGAWDEDSMSFKDRALCKLLQKAVAKQNPEALEPWAKALMDAIGKKCDWVDEKYLEPVYAMISALDAAE